MLIPILVKNHTEVDIDTLDKSLLNGIATKHFELREMEEEYEFKYKGEWCDVVAICFHNMLVTIVDKSGVEKTVRFLLNLRLKD